MKVWKSGIVMETSDCDDEYIYQNIFCIDVITLQMKNFTERLFGSLGCVYDLDCKLSLLMPNNDKMLFFLRYDGLHFEMLIVNSSAFNHVLWDYNPTANEVIGRYYALGELSECMLPSIVSHIWNNILLLATYIEVVWLIWWNICLF